MSDYLPALIVMILVPILVALFRRQVAAFDEKWRPLEELVAGRRPASDELRGTWKNQAVVATLQLRERRPSHWVVSLRRPSAAVGWRASTLNPKRRDAEWTLEASPAPWKEALDRAGVLEVVRTVPALMSVESFASSRAELEAVFEDGLPTAEAFRLQLDLLTRLAELSLGAGR